MLLTLQLILAINSNQDIDDVILTDLRFRVQHVEKGVGLFLCLKISNLTCNYYFDLIRDAFRRLTRLHPQAELHFEKNRLAMLHLTITYFLTKVTLLKDAGVLFYENHST